MEISGSRVLVTGASRGIGRELACGFAAAGADVALVARSTTELYKDSQAELALLAGRRRVVEMVGAS
jgi:short-subunit dehydrogenase